MMNTTTNEVQVVTKHELRKTIGEVYGFTLIAFLFTICFVTYVWRRIEALTHELRSLGSIGELDVGE